MEHSEKCYLSVLRCENLLRGKEKTMVLTKALCSLVKQCGKIEEITAGNEAVVKLSLQDTVEGRIISGVSDFIASGQEDQLTSRCNNLSLVTSAIRLMKRLGEYAPKQDL